MIILYVYIYCLGCFRYVRRGNNDEKDCKERRKERRRPPVQRMMLLQRTPGKHHVDQDFVWSRQYDIESPYPHHLIHICYTDA